MRISPSFLLGSVVFRIFRMGIIQLFRGFKRSLSVRQQYPPTSVRGVVHDDSPQLRTTHHLSCVFNGKLWLDWFSGERHRVVKLDLEKLEVAGSSKDLLDRFLSNGTR